MTASRALAPIFEDSDLHCDECSLLNAQQHRFAELLAASQDRKLSFYGAGYEAESWTQRCSALLAVDNLWISYAFHCEKFSQKTVNFGRDLRAQLWSQANANVHDLFVSHDADSAEWEKARNMIKRGGVEIRDEKGTRVRNPTDDEILLAFRPIVGMRPKLKHELTTEEQMQAETITIDPRGKVMYGTGRAAAQRLFAKLEGLEADRVVKVDVTVGIKEWGARMCDALDEEVLALSQRVSELEVLLSAGEEGGNGALVVREAVGGLSESVSGLVVRVLRRVG